MEVERDGEERKETLFHPDNVARDDDTVGGKVEAHVTLVIGRGASLLAGGGGAARAPKSSQVVVGREGAMKSEGSAQV